MTLAEIRAQFVRESGRYDLMNNDGSDNGADFYIKAGNMMLDRMLDSGKSNASYLVDLLPGHDSVIIRRARAVYEVWVVADGSRRKLIKSTVREMRQGMQNEIDAQQTGAPLYYSNHYHSKASDALTQMPAMYLEPGSQGSDYNAIYFGVKADALYPIEVKGLFYSKELALETDMNFWSIMFPDVLIQACLMRLEGFMRNSNGYSDSYLVLQQIVADIDKDTVAQQIVDVTQMEG